MPTSEIKIESLCFHCGSPCEEDKKTLEKKQFCCSGCLAVHSILMQHELGNYYNLENFPGVRTQNRSSFEFADNDEIAEKFIDFKNEEITKIKIKVPAIHCSSCIWLLENLNLLNPGIIEARVNFQEQEVRISFEHKEISLKVVLELLDKIGYTPDLGLDGGEDVSKKNNTRLVKQLAFAGFVFGNVMLFSFPDYFGFVSAEDHSYGSVFSYLNLILSIPLVIYSGRDYLNKAIFSTVSVLIVACPCALALAYPFATGSAKRLLARSKYYLKNASIIEKLAKTKKVVFDKTGTLTQAMSYKPTYVGKSLSVEEKLIVKSLAYMSDHPYSRRDKCRTLLKKIFN